MSYLLSIGLGLPDSTILFEDSVPIKVFLNIKQKFNITDEDIQNNKNEPIVYFSTKEPQDIETWHKNPLKNTPYIIQYAKEVNGVLKFHYQIINGVKIQKQQIITITVILVYSIIISNMLRYDILYIHGVLTQKGDVFFGPSYCGKTTLAHRLFFNNPDNKALVSDGFILNLQKDNLAYPIPEIWLVGKITIFDNPYKNNIGYKLRNVYQLLKGQKEQVIKENKDKWIKTFFDCNRMLFNIPFAFMRGTSYRLQKQKLIDCGEGMRERIEKRYQQLFNKFIQNNQLKYLAFSANTTDFHLKVQNI